jgi:hypothetical protein
MCYESRPSVPAPLQSRPFSPDCRDRSHPHWSTECNPTKSHVRSIRAGSCRGCDRAYPGRLSRGKGHANPSDWLHRPPPWPFFLAADCGHTGPSLSILPHDRAVADRLTFGEHVVNVARIGIDQDRTWGLLAVVMNDLTPIGGRNPCLAVRRIRQLLPVPRGEIGVRHRRRRSRHPAEQRLENVLGRGRGHRGKKRRDRNPDHENLFDAASQADLATDQQVFPRLARR